MQAKEGEMSLRSSRMYGAAVPTMPPGLVELMEGLAKDVLKNGPDNIYEFCAQHMKKLIEIRDGVAEEKEQEKAERCKSVEDINMVAENHVIANKNETETDPKLKRSEESDQFDENILQTNDQSENEIGSEQKHSQSDENNILDSNIKAIVECVDDDNTKPPVEIRGSKTEEDVLRTPVEAFNENSASLMSDTLAISINDKEIADIIEPATTEKNIVNENTDTNETNLFEADHLSKEENIISQDIKPLDSDIDLQSVDKTIHENTDANFDSVNESDTTKSPQKDSHDNEGVVNESESNNIHVLESSDISIKNDDWLEPINYYNQAMDGTEDSSRDKSSEVGNEAANSMDLETAAITIQKVFRAFLFKSKTLSTDEVTNIGLNYLVENEEKEAEKDVSTTNKERRSVISRMDTMLQTVNEEKSLSLSTDDSSTLSSAATIIQAHVRGFLVRCKMPFNKTVSTASVLDSDIPSAASFDSDHNQQVNKTVLNIHIVPERNDLISRDESLLTSLDLSLDGSPRHSSNLHPLGYDISERRKQLKREDAVQSVTPPSNNSGKVSEEIDSVKDIALNGNHDEPNLKADDLKKDDQLSEFETSKSETCLENFKAKFKEMRNITSDEADVVTPFVTDGPSADNINSTSKLLHSGEFHDIVLPTMVSRNNSSVVREFQNVLVYFLLWSPS